MQLISIREEDSTHLHLAGLAPNVIRASRMIKFYNEYVSKLGSISQQIQQEKAQFESEKLEFKVPQSLVGLIIGKQGVNKKAIQDKYPGVKIYVEDGDVDAIIHLSGKDIAILE